MTEYVDYGDIEDFGYGSDDYGAPEVDEFERPGISTILKAVIVSVLIIILLSVFLLPISEVIRTATVSGGAVDLVAPWANTILDIVPVMIILGGVVLVTMLIIAKRRKEYNQFEYY